MAWYRHTCTFGDSRDGVENSGQIFSEESDQKAQERIRKQNKSFTKLGGFIVKGKLERGSVRLGTDKDGNAKIIFKPHYKLLIPHAGRG